MKNMQDGLEQRIDTKRVSISSIIKKGVYSLALGAAIFSMAYLCKPKAETDNILYRNYDTLFCTDSSQVSLRDFDRDGSYDWKTEYIWDGGVMTGMKTTTKEKYLMYAVDKDSPNLTVVSDTENIR